MLELSAKTVTTKGGITVGFFRLLIYSKARGQTKWTSLSVLRSWKALMMLHLLPSKYINMMMYGRVCFQGTCIY